MANAAAWAWRSTCSRAQVGCVVSKNSRVLVTGYNGAPAGMPHCIHVCDCDIHSDLRRVPYGPLTHTTSCNSQQPCLVVVHAEANAIAYAAKYGAKLEGAEMHTTRSPCLACAQIIVNAGIVRVAYLDQHRENRGVTLLMDAGVEVVQLDRSFENHDGP